MSPAARTTSSSRLASMGYGRPSSSRSRHYCVFTAGQRTRRLDAQAQRLRAYAAGPYRIDQSQARQHLVLRGSRCGRLDSSSRRVRRTGGVRACGPTGQRCPSRARQGESRKPCHAEHRRHPNPTSRNTWASPRRSSSTCTGTRGRQGDDLPREHHPSRRRRYYREEAGNDHGHVPRAGRVRAPRAGANSSLPSQCCWTNGYVQVTVVE